LDSECYGSARRIFLFDEFDPIGEHYALYFEFSPRI
jgi:hypothetical protein